MRKQRPTSRHGDDAEARLFALPWGAEKRPIPRAPEPEAALRRWTLPELQRTARLLGISSDHLKGQLTRAIGRRLRSAAALRKALAFVTDVVFLRRLATVVLEGRVALCDLPYDVVSEALLECGLVLVGQAKGRPVAFVPEGVRGPYAETLLHLLEPVAADFAPAISEALRDLAATSPPAETPCAPGLPTARGRTRLATPGPDRVLELDVCLADVGIPVWRRLLVSYQRPLGALHQIVQIAFGWVERGPHWFIRSATGQLWADPRRRIDRMCLDDEWKTPIRTPLATPGARLFYGFELGAHWGHEIQTRSVHAPDLVDAEPRVVAAEGACPPVDFATPRYYGPFVEEWREGEHRDWNHDLVGSDFDPDRVDLDRVNARLADL